MRAEDVLYAAAVAVLAAWLVFGAGSSRVTPLPEPATRALRAASLPPATRATAAPPRVAAEATIDGVPFHILVSEGPPAVGVAVSAAPVTPEPPPAD